jgi:hypothetical protein
VHIYPSNENSGDTILIKLPPRHPPPPQAQPQHHRIRAEIQRHPAVQDRHFIDEPIVEGEKGEQRDCVDKECRSRPLAEPDEQPAQHRLRAETADHQRACRAQMLIGGVEHQRLHPMRRDQAPATKDEVGERDQALDMEDLHGAP